MSPDAPQPTVEQVLALPLSLTVEIPDRFTDANGHMNIAHYLALHSDAGWVAYGRLGLGEERARQGGPAVFDTQHFLAYLREVHAGDTVSLHGRVLGRTAKALHFQQYLVNRTTGELANTFECLSLSVDLTTRRTVAFPSEVAATIDARYAVDSALPWVARTCGAIALR